MNLVSLAMQFLTPDMIGRIASGLGLDKGLAGKAISAALPSILAGIVGLSAKPDGLKSLTNALGNQDPGLLGSLSGMLGGSNQSSLISNGSSMLSGLLGGSATSALGGAVSKFASIGDGPAKSLLGILAPVVMGTIGKQQQSAGLDAGGLARMLMGQKDNIASAMPPGFAQLLSGTGLLDSIGPNLKAVPGGASVATPTTTTTTTSTAPKATTTTTTSTASRTPPVSVPYATAKPASASLWPWLALAALAGLGWWYYFISGENRPRTMAQSPAAIQAMTVNGVDVGGQMRTLSDNLRATLGSIKDAGSAQAALPKLQATVSELDKVKSLAGSMPAPGKSALASLVSSLMGTLNPIFDTALAIPGVSAIVKAPIDQIRTAMTGLSKM
jgi:Bacterial protein of unknown function (DUF937)